MQKLLYALRDNELISVDNVERGRKCNCVCPYCKQPLIAKKGNFRIHHFAHDKDFSCEHGYETSLHLLAKEILSESKSIVLPALTRGSRNKFILEKSIEVKILDVRLEQYIDDVKPDVIIDTEMGTFYIEIYVTHKVDSVKIDKLKEHGINTIEVNLSNKKEAIGKDELSTILLSDNSLKKWIYHRSTSKLNQYISHKNKIDNCRLQKTHKPDYMYCVYKCEFYLDEIDNKHFYCKKAQEVKSYQKKVFVDMENCDDGPVICRNCNTIMVLEYTYQGAFYVCKCGFKIRAEWKDRHCSNCKGMLISKNGRYGKYLQCSKCNRTYSL